MVVVVVVMMILMMVVVVMMMMVVVVVMVVRVGVGGGRGVGPFLSDGVFAVAALPQRSSPISLALVSLITRSPAAAPSAGAEGTRFSPFHVLLSVTPPPEICWLQHVTHTHTHTRTHTHTHGDGGPLADIIYLQYKSR